MLFRSAYQAGLNFTFFCLEDTEFMKRYQDGVPVYDEYKKLEDKYAFVFFDGPHDDDALNRELEFFVPRAPVGAVFVFDDVWMMNHDTVCEQKWLFPNGFELLERKNIKASYRKIK